MQLVNSEFGKVPRTLIKYFDSNSLQHFHRGSIKFGLLNDYRKSESGTSTLSQGRFGDTEEGLLTVELSPFKESFGEITVAGRNIRKATQINAHVFCSTIGPYCLDQHRAMFYGVDSKYGRYNANADLTHFCEFDTVNLLRAVMLSLKQMPSIQGICATLTFAPIRYLVGQRTIKGSLDELIGKRNEPQAFDQALLEKSAVFSVEREYRIAIHSNFGGSISEDPAIFVSNLAIRGAILRFGTLDEELGKLHHTRKSQNA